MILCEFTTAVSPRCLEWLEYLSGEHLHEGDVGIKKTEAGIVRSDESDEVLVNSFLSASVEVSYCGEAIRFTFYPPRHVEIGGEAAQTIFSLIAPDTIHVKTHVPTEFLKRHSNCKFIRDFIEYPISYISSLN